MKRIFLTLTILVLIKINLFAQFTEFHPELDWYTIEGKYVSVHYHNDAERTARLVCKIADDVWEPITSLYQYEPDKVHFVIKDIDDYSNGATFFFDNKIEIWASSMDFDLRGTHNWLRNVITHEFTHMVQIQASMKVGRRVPALFLQMLNYEDKRRPDILYGFPNVIASYPVATINIPAWFAEGTAQYMRKEFNYENWDSHRDMILRCYALDDKLLTWNQMGVFGKTSLGNESVYNSGFALTKYIVQKYGEAKLREISQNLGRSTTFTIDKAIEDATGMNGEDLYNEWRDFLKKDYGERSKNILSGKVEGQKIVTSGFGNFYPEISRDGKKMIYVSNQGQDYMSLSSLFYRDLETGEEKLLEAMVGSAVSFLPDGKKIIYSKIGEDNPGWTNIHDLYIYDIEEEDETRLTHGLRALNPNVSPDGSKITFVFQKDGTSNIGLVDIDGQNFKRLTFFENGEQVYFPKFSDGGNIITFDYSYANGRDIAKVNADGSEFGFLLNEAFDERNGSVVGNKLFYSSDETGIFNVYSYDLVTKVKTQITNVIGGAFMGALSARDIFYAGYTSDGYKIFKLEINETKNNDIIENYVMAENPPLNKENPNGDINNFDIEYLKNYNDKITPEYKKKKYSGAFTNLTVMPFVRFDNYNTSNKTIDNIKPGVYLMSNDMLNRFGFFAGASINTRMERDLFLVFDYKSKLPILYSLGIKPELSVELYSISRKADSEIGFGADSTSGTVIYDEIVPIEVTYNLFEADFVLRHKIFSRGNELELRYVYSRYTATIGSFVIPIVKQLYPSLDDTYLVGKAFRAKFKHEVFLPYKDSDINPVGRKVELDYNYEMNKFNNDGDYEVTESGWVQPAYNDFDFHRLELNWKEHIRVMKGHTLTAQLRAGTILGPDMPDFFDFYLGGLIGMKAFPFYAISGNEVGWFNLTYRFPLFRNIDSRLGHLYLDKIFFSVYADIGNAWNGSMPGLSKFKKGFGAELRVKLNSFYLFPTSFFFNAAYSPDEFTRVVRDETVRYGKEWRFYGGILFDFPF